MYVKDKFLIILEPSLLSIFNLFEKIEKKFLGKLNEKNTLMNPKITFLWKIDLNTDFPES